mmetsp:Transcript_3027/g.9939  ORF Transcript_3027/g.9939 Transcript_3027/m.9939 type:complete len:237 (+) Transcript_3027:464-1174(+)
MTGSTAHLCAAAARRLAQGAQSRRMARPSSGPTAPFHLEGTCSWSSARPSSSPTAPSLGGHVLEELGKVLVQLDDEPVHGLDLLGGPGHAVLDGGQGVQLGEVLNHIPHHAVALLLEVLAEDGVDRVERRAEVGTVKRLEVLADVRLGVRLVLGVELGGHIRVLLHGLQVRLHGGRLEGGRVHVGVRLGRVAKAEVGHVPGLAGGRRGECRGAHGAHGLRHEATAGRGPRRGGLRH